MDHYETVSVRKRTVETLFLGVKDLLNLPVVVYLLNLGITSV